MGPNETDTFGTKPKQIASGSWTSLPNQMRPNEIITFGTKTNDIW